MDTTETIRIGRRLRGLRRGQLMTQSDLAEASGMHIDQIGRIERDGVEPRFSTIRKLAAALEVEPRELLQ